VVRRFALAVGLAAMPVAACALLDDPPPENTCKTDADCFRAQGEVCNPDKKICEPGVDAGPEMEAGGFTLTAGSDAP
jgi:hypothetical protein